MARERKDQTAVVEIAADGSERVFSWRQLYEAMEKVAAEMDKGGIRKGSQVIIGLPNTIEHIVSSLAAWHLGACCIPISCSLKEFERDRVCLLYTSKGPGVQDRYMRGRLRGFLLPADRNAAWRAAGMAGYQRHQ